MNIIKLSEIPEYDSFQNIVKIDGEFEIKINDAYNSILSYYAKFSLNRFYFKFLEMFDRLTQYYGADNENVIEFSQSLKTIIIPYFEKLTLEIKNKDDLEHLGYIFEIALVVMDEAIERMDFDLAYEVFFQIMRRIENKKE